MPLKRPYYRDPLRASVLLQVQRGSRVGSILGDDGPVQRVMNNPLRYADANDWNFAGDFTIELAEVTYPSTPSARAGLFGHYLATGNLRSWTAFYDNTQGGLNATVSTNGTANLALVADVWAPTAGQKYYITLERSGTTVRLYRDGAIIDSGTLSGALFNATDHMYVGAYNDSGTIRIHTGTIGGCRITTAARFAGAHALPPFPWPA